MSTFPITTDTRSAVQDVADTLLAEGKRPSVNAVRMRLGRGSDTTIASALNDWWTNLGQRLARLQSRPDIPDEVFKAADGLWTSALEQAQQALAADRETLRIEHEKNQEQLRCAERQRDESKKETDELEQNLTKVHETLRETDKAQAAKAVRVKTLGEKVEDLRKQLTEARERMSEQMQQFERRRLQDAERFDRMERRLVAQLEREKNERIQAATRLTDEAKQARAAEHRVREALNVAQVENNQLHQGIETTTTLLRHREHELRGLRDQLELRSGELSTMKMQLDLVQQERDHHMKKNDTLLKTINDDRVQIQRLRERIVEFETRMKMQRKKKFQRIPLKIRRKKI